MTPQDRFEHFVRLVSSGLSAKKIAREIKTQPPHVYRIASVFGISFRKMQRAKDAAILREAEAGISYEQIAARHGISAQAVSVIALKNGIRRRKDSRGVSK